MTDASFAAMAITRATLEIPNLTTGFAADTTTYYCTPPAPVSSETVTRLMIDTPNKTFEVHLQDNPTIKQGYRLVIGTTKYNVKYVEPYTWLPSGDTRVRLILEDLRNP